jgi:hypothetical protein
MNANDNTLNRRFSVAPMMERENFREKLYMSGG